MCPSAIPRLRPTYRGFAVRQFGQRPARSANIGRSRDFTLAP